MRREPLQILQCIWSDLNVAALNCHWAACYYAVDKVVIHLSEGVNVFVISSCICGVTGFCYWRFLPNLFVHNTQGSLQGSASANEAPVKLLVLALCHEGFVKPVESASIDKASSLALILARTCSVCIVLQHRYVTPMCFSRQRQSVK